jgi:glycosyltransferase involved in cell wall biosynthesis
VIYNGVDTEKFLPIEHENKKLELISIGNLIPLKGHKYTILAIKKLVEAGYDNVHLRIFGRGEQETELVQLVQKIKMENYVQFMGYVQYEQVAKALQMSDIFILPSYYEALGCVYLEAMACGIPVIGCKENGIDEIIKDGEDGYLIQGKSVESIVESIKKMLENRRYKVMGVQARKHVEEKYSWRSSAQSLIKLYRNIIG